MYGLFLSLLVLPVIKWSKIMTSFHLYDQSLPVITELLNKDSSKVAKVFTLDAQSSIDVRRILSDEDVSFRSSSSRKRKSAESAFDAFSHQSSGSTFFLARDNLSLQLKDLPFMKKFVSLNSVIN